MQHIEALNNMNGLCPLYTEDLYIKATGRYYTPANVANHLVCAVWEKRQEDLPNRAINIVDPFAGDGRLIQWLIEYAHQNGCRALSWNIYLWDIHNDGLMLARDSISALGQKLDIPITLNVICCDSFRQLDEWSGYFDVVITNPPWELLKPDQRHLSKMKEAEKASYINALKELDSYLALNFPLSQPVKKFAGWGTNLARAGVELSIKLAKDNGIVGIVSPASLLADDMSAPLRKWLLESNQLVDAAFFPAEAKLFEKADVSASTLTFIKNKASVVSPKLSSYDLNLKRISIETIEFPKEFLESTNYIIPISFGIGGIKLLQKFLRFPCLSTLEGGSNSCLWAGREIDETRINDWFSEKGNLFIKGKMIDRFCIVETPQNCVLKPEQTLPTSVNFERIAWRDISRPNQERRIKAALIPKGWIAGNSLGVAYFKDNDPIKLRMLLGIMSSFPFEFQLRSFLATGHVSLGALRKVRIPFPIPLQQLELLVESVEKALNSEKCASITIEALSALLYDLTEQELIEILSHFSKVPTPEKEAVILEFRRLSQLQFAHKSSISNRQPRDIKMKETLNIKIPNHYSAKLSDLDMQMIVHIPPGGNWKNIPETVPSKRLENIRTSYAEGKGSRSTYYGRLLADKPAYTINTYFGRPGNGCHVHYDYIGKQHRVISQREAARLQSFPDNFYFHGSKTSISTQIGNAVPPLLAFQIAKSLSQVGCYIDLFSGAGGMGLGFKWAGWKPIIANDIEGSFLQSYARNVHDCTIVGDIRDKTIHNAIVTTALDYRTKNPDKPLWVLGGPPCQGFSTAGKRRSRTDERNHLFWNYKKILEELKPDGFIFENVTGILNMEGGQTFREVKNALSETMDIVSYGILSAEQYAIPQRRKRVIIIGRNGVVETPQLPKPLTDISPTASLFGGLLPSAISVEEALSDLPVLKNGQDGSYMDYRHEAKSIYQALMRGLISPDNYLEAIQNDHRLFDAINHPSQQPPAFQIA